MPPPVSYDAFISYAHEDAATIEWLHELLQTYWVPGRKRRTIFLDRRSMAAGGGLSEQLCEHLRNSRFLIVCWSRAAVESRWIAALEIQEFLKTHEPSAVLICSVGDEKDDPPLPAPLQEIEERLADPLYKPDLRGHPETKRGKERRRAEETALSLLAPLVGLRSKDEILDRRKRRQRIAIAATVALLLAIAGAWRAWKWWLSTPDGLHYLTVQRVLDAAERDTIDDPKIVSTAEALAVSDGRAEVEAFAGFVRDEDFRALVLAAGYASLRPPDCAAANRALAGVETDTARLWPRAFLVTQRHCGGNVIANARPPAPDAKWALALAAAGLPPEPPAAPLTAEEKVRIAVLRGTAVESNDLHTWLADSDAYDVYYGATWLLADADRKGRLRDAGLTPLFDLAAQAAATVDGPNDWVLSQAVAAALAGAGRREEAAALLRNADTPSTVRRDPNDGRGWAWRALAQHRLGDRAAAEKSFEEAFACGRADIPASRTWDEWRDIALAAALAGDWKRARNAAEEPGDERLRIAHHAALLEHWTAIVKR